MPAYSTLRTFVEAVRSGLTNITRGLETVVNDPQNRLDRAVDMNDPAVARGQFPPWLRTLLMQAGLSQAEVDHMERWADSQKEIVRLEIVSAIQGNRPLRFGWELHGGDDVISEVRRDANQDVRVVFRSPRNGVQLSGLNFGSIQVEA